MQKPFVPTPILENSLNELGCTGILLGVSENGNVETYSAGSIPSADHDRPYYIYSISKSFTAVAILKLCEDQGDFLDERFSSFFPDTKIPHGITVRQMLNHSSGLSDYFALEEYQAAYAVHYPDLEGNRVSISLVLNKSLPQTPFDLANEIVRHYVETRAK